MSRPTALAVLPAGVLPFAVLTWWSLVTPGIGLLVPTVGIPAIRSHRPTAASTRGFRASFAAGGGFGRRVT